MGKIAQVFQLNGCDSVESMLDRSHTNWDVEVMPANAEPLLDHAGYDNGGYQAVVRPDTRTALSFVSERFRPNSHRKQLAPLDAFIRNGDLVPVTCSVWDNGAILAYQIQAPQLDVVIHGKDVVSPLLTLVFGYGFKISDSAFFADFRWFCKNQMGTVSKLMTERVRHRGNVLGNYADIVGKRIGELGGELKGHYEAMQRMAQLKLTGGNLYKYLGTSMGMTEDETIEAYRTAPEDLCGVAANLPRVLEAYKADDCGAAGTVWHAYNALTRFETHLNGRTEATRQRRMLLGPGGGAANRAYANAVEIVGL